MNNRPAILVVDDQIPNIELLEAFLIPQGYDMIRAQSGDEALSALKEHAIDLILLDVMMPGMNGFELTRRVREIPSLRQLPIMLVTALREKDDHLKGVEAGCDDFISKPVDKIELLVRVRALLKVKAYHDLINDYQKQLESEIAMRTQELHQALADTKAASLEIIQRLSTASECKDEATGNHISRMSHYAAAVARCMGLSNSSVEMILSAAPMHDLGKIGIPDRILLKPAKLSPLEWEIMKKHTLIGADILKDSGIELLRVGEVIARTHHEKWDGSGYPAGLRGVEIPLYGRIVAIADVFDAMTSIRPYKAAFSVEAAVDAIRAGRGNHFDPDVVDAFLEILDEIRTIKQIYETSVQQEVDMQEYRTLLSQYRENAFPTYTA